MLIYTMKRPDSLLSSEYRMTLSRAKSGRCPSGLELGTRNKVDTFDRDFKPLVKKDSPGELLFLSRKDVESRIGPDWQSPSPADAESKDRSRLFESARLPHTLPALVFLGIDDRPDASKDSVPARVDPKDPQGVPYFAIDAGRGQDQKDWEVEGGEFGDARASASSMSGWEAGVFAQARALVDWNCRNLVSHPETPDLPLRRAIPLATLVWVSVSVLMNPSSAQLVDHLRTRYGVVGRETAPPPSRNQRVKSHVSRPRDYTILHTHEQTLYVYLTHQHQHLQNVV